MAVRHVVEGCSEPASGHAIRSASTMYATAPVGLPAFMSLLRRARVCDQQG
jgi:hypothetical protein